MSDARQMASCECQCLEAGMTSSCSTLESWHVLVVVVLLFYLWRAHGGESDSDDDEPPKQMYS